MPKEGHLGPAEMQRWRRGKCGMGVCIDRLGFDHGGVRIQCLAAKGMHAWLPPLGVSSEKGFLAMAGAVGGRRKIGKLGLTDGVSMLGATGWQAFLKL